MGSLFVMIIALVLMLPSAAAADLSSDRQALLDFSGAVPHSLSKKLNWNTNSSVCTAWSGVTCSNATKTRVIELRLPGTAFYGSIPRNTLGRLDALSSLSLRSNALSGTLPPDILSLPSLRKVYLQQNNLSGDIPSNLSQQLAFLDLSSNSFTGSIPSSILNLNHLSTLNLNNNSLTGPIPDLSSLSNLQQLNLSNNNFNGSIPTSLQHFPASSFQGNSLLCGSPLQQCSSPISPSPSPSPAPAPSPVPAPSPASSHTKPPPSPKSKPAPPPALAASKRKSKLATGSTVGIAAASSIALALLFLLCWILRRSKKRKAARNLAAGAKKEQFGKNRVLGDENSRLVFLQGGDSYDFDHLLTATAEVLGKGTYGTTYKATLQEGATLAVKRLKQALVSKMVFEQHMHNVGRVSPHPSIIPLRAYYHSRNEHLLVYDYQPYGNLATLLHGNRPGLGRTLEWRPRLNICLGAAQGIAHIHSHSGGGRLIHGNIKSSNILLTRDLSGCMSDFGITPLVGLITTASRKAGYQAPEVMELGKYTQKSDVYSFGVVLLEVLTGKAPLEDGVDLPRWVHSVDRERWRAEVFDSKLIKNHNTEEEMAEMLQLALACVSRLPESRPDMDKAIKSIQQILHYPDESGNLLGL